MLLVLLAIALSVSRDGFAASFDCAKAETSVGRTICLDSELSIADELMK